LIAFSALLIETIADATICSQGEVYDFMYEESECENCGMVVGPIEEEFFPCLVVVDQESISWLICVECAFPMLHPGES
jgi:hypothetical protein